jgi:hypothetical protein
MERKPVSNAELAALGAFQGDIERSGNVRQQAVNHNLGRNVRVVKLLAYVGLLRRTGTKFPAAVECVAAVRQNFSSSQSMTLMGLPTGPMQAAHYLPGQVRIGGRPVWEFANNHATRGQIEFLFAEVEHLPLMFNQADSAAEAKGQTSGLCAALAKSCRSMLAPGAANLPAVQLPGLEAAYKEWHTGAIAALTSAIASKTEKTGIPPLAGNRFDGYTPESIEARSTASKSQWNRDGSLGVLELYLADQQQRGWSWVMSSCQQTLRDLQAAFRA